MLLRGCPIGAGAIRPKALLTGCGTLRSSPRSPGHPGCYGGAPNRAPDAPGYFSEGLADAKGIATRLPVLVHRLTAAPPLTSAERILVRPVVIDRRPAEDGLLIIAPASLRQSFPMMGSSLVGRDGPYIPPLGEAACDVLCKIRQAFRPGVHDTQDNVES
jgi:hypothetical protein